MIEFIKGIFLDHRTPPRYSSKRFVAIICAFCLCGGSLYWHTNEWVSSVLILGCGALGITAIDRNIDNKNNTKDDEKNSNS